ncbi:hypothetical protein [Streptomyces ficellus]|uniref:Uncharacterized protein n=1 Tax=Streptomyces ficellus TaxID=1977088 RepID=A0A6I6F6M5_9ACTN|nr:hypothetical protein [Streptomyces ficellus]QGV78611.1 hypothetical protein EIZ62_10415 [Streptomyces ficellus]
MNATSVGALLFCRADRTSVRPPALLLRERLLLAPAGPDWSVLVPEGAPWREGAEPVDRVVAGWAGALTVGVTWPVVALWWDTDRAGCVLATGFRRPVGYTWLADGTPVGEDEAMHTFAERLGLDPVMDARDLEPLTRPDELADAPARLLGLAAVLARHGLTLPPGLVPGTPAVLLWAAARERGAEQLEWQGWLDAVRSELDAVEEGPLGPWICGPRARALATAHLAAGLPLLAWALTRRSPGWAATATLLVTQGALGLAYDRLRTRSRAPRPGPAVTTRR